MIITKNEKPSRSLYYLGAVVLSLMADERLGVVDSYELFDKMNQRLTLKMSFSHYLYVLDWLYLLDAIDLTHGGDIKRCI